MLTPLLRQAVAAPLPQHVEITHNGDLEDKEICALWEAQQEIWKSPEQHGWERAWAAYMAACDVRDQRWAAEPLPTDEEAEAGYMRH